MLWLTRNVTENQRLDAQRPAEGGGIELAFSFATEGLQIIAAPRARPKAPAPHPTQERIACYTPPAASAA